MSMETAPAPAFPTKLDLAEKTREPLMALLNERLADTAGLYSQVEQRTAT